MLENVQAAIAEVEAFTGESADSAEQFRLKYLSKKGLIAQLFGEFKSVPVEQKKEFGVQLNKLKTIASEKFESLQATTAATEDASFINDFTLPSNQASFGSRHPLSLVRKQIIDIFSRIGFTVKEGPEIEDDWHVFSALNFPEEHPARDMQDTFFIEKDPDILLRTHTSSVQVHLMENEKPPIRSVLPGRVFRNEAISARAHCIFHQLEALYIDKDVSFADLKQTLLFFAKELFGKDIQIRLRPSFFPFTEPSAEMDISCSICGGKGCNVCKYTGWVEILGCGMVDPNVLESNGIDSNEYSGFALGMGIERITMLKYQINDIRLFFENDTRFIEQFATES